MFRDTKITMEAEGVIHLDREGSEAVVQGRFRDIEDQRLFYFMCMCYRDGRIMLRLKFARRVAKLRVSTFLFKFLSQLVS